MAREKSARFASSEQFVVTAHFLSGEGGQEEHKFGFPTLPRAKSFAATYRKASDDAGDNFADKIEIHRHIKPVEPHRVEVIE